MLLLWLTLLLQSFSPDLMSYIQLHGFDVISARLASHHYASVGDLAQVSPGEGDMLTMDCRFDGLALTERVSVGAAALRNLSLSRRRMHFSTA